MLRDAFFAMLQQQNHSSSSASSSFKCFLSRQHRKSNNEGEDEENLSYVDDDENNPSKPLVVLASVLVTTAGTSTTPDIFQAVIDHLRYNSRRSEIMKRLNEFAQFVVVEKQIWLKSFEATHSISSSQAVELSQIVHDESVQVPSRIDLRAELVTKVLQESDKACAFAVVERNETGFWRNLGFKTEKEIAYPPLGPPQITTSTDSSVPSFRLCLLSKIL